MNRRTRILLILLLLAFLLYRYRKGNNGSNGNGNGGIQPIGWGCEDGLNIITNYSFNDCENKISLGEISGNPSNPSQAAGDSQKYFVNNWMRQNPYDLIDSVKWYASGSDYSLVSNTCIVPTDPPAMYQYFNRISAQGGMAVAGTGGMNNLGNPYVPPSPYFYTWASFIDYLNSNSQFTLTTPLQYTDSYERVHEILWEQAQYGYNIVFGFGICECIGSVSFDCNCVQKSGGQYNSKEECELSRNSWNA